MQVFRGLVVEPSGRGSHRGEGSPGRPQLSLSLSAGVSPTLRSLRGRAPPGCQRLRSRAGCWVRRPLRLSRRMQVVDARYTMQRSALEGRRGVQGVARTLRRDGDAGLLLSVRFASTLHCCFDLSSSSSSAFVIVHSLLRSRSPTTKWSGSTSRSRHGGWPSPPSLPGWGSI